MEKLGYLGLVAVVAFVILLLLNRTMVRKLPESKGMNLFSTSSPAYGGSPLLILAGGIAAILIFLVDHFDLYNYLHFILKYWEY